jgi:hypothetical protein
LSRKGRARLAEFFASLPALAGFAGLEELGATSVIEDMAHSLISDQTGYSIREVMVTELAGDRQ